MPKRKYAPDPAMDAIESLMNRRDKLLKLLKRIEGHLDWCPICFGTLKNHTNGIRVLGHEDDCDLAEELKP